ncbi:hypothetical protein RI367_007484 [Sorochytrium milnesiophthora]
MPPRKNYRKKPASGSDNEDDAHHGSGEPDTSILDDLRELRKLKTKPKGVAADALLLGTRPTSSSAATAPAASASTRPDMPLSEQEVFNMKEGGMVDMDKLKKMDRNESSLLSGFTGSNRTLDATKHMNRFIEQEMRRRRGDDASDKDKAAAAEPTTVLEKLNQELYHIPEHLRQAQRQIQEGNAGASSAMLTAIAEVDLGIDAKLKNIERTEQAKQTLVDRMVAARAKQLREQKLLEQQLKKSAEDVPLDRAAGVKRVLQVRPEASSSLHHTHSATRWRLTREMRESALASSSLSSALHGGYEFGEDEDMAANSEFMGIAEEIIGQDRSMDGISTNDAKLERELELERRLERGIREHIARAELEDALGRDQASDEAVAERFRKRQKR